MPAVVGVGLAGALGLAAAAGTVPLAGGLLVVQALLASRSMAARPLPTQRRSVVLCLLAAAAATVGVLLTGGERGGGPVAAVLGLAIVFALVLQLLRRDGRPALLASLTLSLTVAALCVLPVLWLATRQASGGRAGTTLGLLGVAVAALTEALPLNRALRRVLAPLVAAVLGAGGWVLSNAGAPPGLFAGVVAGTLAGAAAALAVAGYAAAESVFHQPPLAGRRAGSRSTRVLAALSPASGAALAVALAAPSAYLLTSVLPS